MRDEAIELVHGSDNVFRDFGDPDADVSLAKALLAAQIIKLLDREKLTVRAAHARTRIAAADFSRIRRCDLGRFTLDRLVTILNRLGSRVELKIKVRPAKVLKAAA
jgi:predicted XRE-type DNA-binding protein